jgi:3-hydroxyisobutyrate dehydrogenase-like beta-hydroxyacid dehydrogenase
MSTVALLGTGLLGSGIAENLLTKGYTVRVWNRSPQKLAPLIAKGAVAGKDPADTVRGCERVHLVLSEDAAVDAVIAALRPGLTPSTWVIDHSTNLPEKVKARFARLRGEGVRYISAPVFMSPLNGREASGMMMVAGPTADFEALQAALSSMTGKLWHAGEQPEVAALLKLAGNAMIFAMIAGMGDLFAMGRQNGVSPEQIIGLFDVFKPQLTYMGQRVVKAGTGPASFELAMARKDLRLMIEAAGSKPTLLLHAMAAAMDRSLTAGNGAHDFSIFAKGS